MNIRKNESPGDVLPAILSVGSWLRDQMVHGCSDQVMTLKNWNYFKQSSLSGCLRRSFQNVTLDISPCPDLK